MLLIGDNSRTAAQRVAAKLEEIGRSLPDGVVARALVRPHQAGRRDHLDGREEPARRRPAGRRRAVPDPGQLPRRLRDGLRHSRCRCSFTDHRHGREQDQRQSDEPRCHRLRHHRRRGGDRGRKLPAPSGGGATSSRPHPHAKASASPRSSPAQRKSSGRACSARWIIGVVYLPILTLTGVEERCSRPWQSRC